MLISIDSTSLTLPADSTMNNAANLLTSIADQVPLQVLYAFGISSIVLLIATIIKYGLGVGLKDIKKMSMLLELSVDICAIIATIIASMETSKSYLLVMFMAFCSIIPILIGSYARQYWLDYSDKGVCWQSVISALVTIATPIIWLVIICEIFFFD